jgi:integrase
MIMLMAASGMRRGALPHLRLKDLTRIDKYGLLKFNVYKKEQESYITYCTPEATILIDQYLKWRERLGEQLTPNSPLFRANFDPLVQTKRPQIIGSEAVGKMINRLLEVTEIKAPSTYNYKKRYETMETHGLRKFFKTTCINAPTI